MNTPDKWAIVEFKGPDEHYRVLAGWYGGYLYGDHWRLNSGITKVEEDGDHYLFHGHSGSVYHCHKDSYGLSTLTASVYLGIEKQHGDSVEVLPSTTDWLSLLKEEDK
jgi:hypothetical protein